MDDDYVIDMDVLQGGAMSRAVALGTDAVTAFDRALAGAVTRVYCKGLLVARIVPPGAEEQRETIPVLVRTGQDSHPTAHWLRALLGGRR